MPNNPPILFAIGDHVDRIEDRPSTAATIIGIQELSDGINYELAYEEGGSGWWPGDCLQPAELVDATPELVRARDENGRFIADDPSTPDVDEAWVKP